MIRIPAVAVLLSEAPSLALYVKLSAPLKLAVGVYVTFAVQVTPGGVDVHGVSGTTALKPPWAGGLTIVNVSGGGASIVESWSLPLSVMSFAVSSLVLVV